MIHRIKIKIYYEDTDAGGVVYYANYLRYLERARTEFLSDCGINVSEYHRNGQFFVVVHVDIDYRRPARLGDLIDVTTEVEERRNASLRLKNVIYRGDILLVEAHTIIACIDRDGKPKKLPDGLRNIG